MLNPIYSELDPSAVKFSPLTPQTIRLENYLRNKIPHKYFPQNILIYGIIPASNRKAVQYGDNSQNET